MAASRLIEIVDTTLRDGEQMQDVSYTPGEKLAIVKVLLDEVRVDHVELTSALVSAGERDAVREVMDWAADHGRVDAIEILGFTDGNRSVDWITALGGTVMNILAKGSLRHVTTQLGKQPAEHFADIAETVAYAGAHGVRCNIYLEDWSGGMLDSPGYVRAMLEELAEIDLWRVMLPDTLGLLSPPQVGEFVGDLVRRYPTLSFDFHGHDDYGVATANTLAAVTAGAACVHCTINGMGERAGNTPLDEVVVGIHDFLGLRTNVDETKLIAASERVEVFSGRRVGFNKPIVGPNVFTQTAGIHADGDHKGDLYTSRLSPERFARRRRYALGKLSGKRSLEFNLTDLGIELDEAQSQLVLERIKELADGKQTITQDDLPFIISDVLETPHDRSFILRSCVVVSSIGLKPVATVKLAHRATPGGEFTEYEASAQGDGGYDAFMNTLRSIAGQLGLELPRLADYNVSIPPGGKSDALVQCSITWLHPDRADAVFTTKGVHSDQVLAAAQATEKMLNLVAAGTVGAGLWSLSGNATGAS